MQKKIRFNNKIFICDSGKCKSYVPDRCIFNFREGDCIQIHTDCAELIGGDHVVIKVLEVENEEKTSN